MSLTILYAVSDNHVIGNKGKLPWEKVSDDFAHFKALTNGHKMIMGRKTFESLPGVLDNRIHLVLSSQEKRHRHPMVRFFTKPEDILKAVDPTEEVFVIGGAQVFDIFLPYANKVHVTTIHERFEGDTFYAPQKFSAPAWTKTAEIKGKVNDKNPYPHTFFTYERVGFRYDLK